MVGGEVERVVLGEYRGVQNRGGQLRDFEDCLLGLDGKCNLVVERLAMYLLALLSLIPDKHQSGPINLLGL